MNKLIREMEGDKVYKRTDSEGKDIIVIEQSDLENSMSLDEIGTLVTKEDLIKDEREFFIEKLSKLNNDKRVIKGITEDGFLELANTIRNMPDIQPPIVLYGYKGGK